MGSGCKGNTPSKQACAQVFSTDCGIWQGPSVPILGICCGDTITEVETSIINKLLEVLDGTGIDLSTINLNNATYLKTLLGVKNKNLLNLVQLLVDSDTDLRQLIADLNAKINVTGPAFSFDLQCLVDECCPPTLTRDQVLQLVIDKLCQLDSIIKQLQDDAGGIGDTINNIMGDFLSSSINTCSTTGIKKTGSGKDTKITIVGMPPPESYIPYFGTLSYFDASGKGMDETPACGWFIANGLNGTVDMRGYTFAGITNGVGGGQLEARVDPALLNEPTLSTSMKDARGEALHKLTSPEMPSHSHTISATGTAEVPLKRWGTRPQGGDAEALATRGAPTGAGASDTVVQAPLNISATISNTGGNQPHNNIQPTKYGVWITRFD